MTLLTAREVAAELKLTPETVLSWCRTGNLPAIRLPSGQIRFRRDEIDAWLADHSTIAVERSLTIIEGGQHA